MLEYALFNELPSPAVYLDIESLEANCQRVSKLANGKKIRIASKSIRCTQVMRYILNAHECFQGIMCYHPSEAIYLAEQGFDDLLLAYPSTDQIALARIGTLTEMGKVITVMIDSIEHIDILSRIANNEGVHFRVCVDVDMSLNLFGFHFGVRRSPIRSVRDLLPIVEAVLQSPSLLLDGIMGYEAQVAGVADQMPSQPIKNQLIRLLKTKSLQDFPIRRKEMVDAILAKGIQLRFVNGGGTGSIHTTTNEDVVTELTVGSAFYSPHLFDYYKDIQFSPTLFYTTPIVRQPHDHIYTCYSGGYIASGSTGFDKQPQLFLPKGSQLISLEGVGEVQTPFYYKGEGQLQIGDVAVFRHSKAGEIAERFNEFHILKKGEIVDKFLTYRGEGMCFH
ncbi:amino acid deaminase/aldolase [Bacillus solimangrovi]|uniref:Amino acid aldolase n=1 Tax=Bacillus solimangrovi TaxID=1305675 RepID=A0A1E5LDC8_9BACI|nr:amino acid deaminase/aldolase [Bacillus solimangrovi]OEH92081.1 amino acid aldolase [Bacillus solimangrovi]